MDYTEVIALENSILDLNKRLLDAKFKLERDTPIVEVGRMRQQLGTLQTNLSNLTGNSVALTTTLGYFGVGEAE